MLKVVAATNNALQPSTIATYLTQMWIGNILQVIKLKVGPEKLTKILKVLSFGSQEKS